VTSSLVGNLGPLQLSSQLRAVCLYFKNRELIHLSRFFKSETRLILSQVLNASDDNNNLYLFTYENW